MVSPCSHASRLDMVALKPQPPRSGIVIDLDDDRPQCLG
jgi:hypothetical protein